MGAVYLAHHPELDRPVAIKVMNPDLAPGAQGVERFRREARAVARLSHPGAVQIHDVESEGEILFLVMEWIEGASLSDRVREGPLSVAEAVRIARALAATLGHAHGMGIVHRDLKPANVLLSPAGEPRLLDFGLARLLSGDRGLTGTGEILGTPAYMAPEAVDDEPGAVGPAADVYGLGALLYEMLSGAPPYRGASALAVVQKIAAGEGPPLEPLAARAPADLVDVVRRAMARLPQDRFPDMESFAQALGRTTPAHVPVRRRAPLRIALGAILLLGATLLVAYAVRDGEDGTDGRENPAAGPPAREKPAVDREKIRGEIGAAFWKGRYRHAAGLARELGDEWTATFALFYGETMPLVVVRADSMAESYLRPFPEESLDPEDRAVVRAVLSLCTGRNPDPLQGAEEALEQWPRYPPLLWIVAGRHARWGDKERARSAREEWRGAVEGGDLDTATAEAALWLLADEPDRALDALHTIAEKEWDDTARQLAEGLR